MGVLCWENESIRRELGPKWEMSKMSKKTKTPKGLDFRGTCLIMLIPGHGLKGKFNIRTICRTQ